MEALYLDGKFSENMPPTLEKILEAYDVLAQEVGDKAVRDRLDRLPKVANVPPDVVSKLRARRCELNGLEASPDTNVVQETFAILYPDGKITDGEPPRKNMEMALERLCRGNPKNDKFSYRLRQLKQKDVPPDVVSKLRDWRRELNGLERGPDTYE